MCRFDFGDYMTDHAHHLHKPQPRSLTFLFMTEMWERFAYFSLQSLLVLFMVKAAHFADSDAYLIFGAYAALVMASPVVGGLISDRALGYLPTINLGLVLLMIGYALIAIQQEVALFIGLAVLICGNGLFKPNISTLLGTMYSPGDGRRDRGFTIFYVGINIGATLGVISCGFLAKRFGWSVAFLTASAVLLIGLIIFNLGIKTIRTEMRSPRDSVKVDDKKKWMIAGCVLFGIVWSLSPFYVMLKQTWIADILLTLMGVVLVGYLGHELKKSFGMERRKFVVCLILIVFSIMFWALYQQAPMSLTLYIARDVNLHVFGIWLPASTIWSLNGIFLILLAPFVVKLWRWLGHHRLEPSAPKKFALGIGFMGAGYLIVAAGTHFVDHYHHTPLTTVVLSYGVQTLGELCLSPIGLSMITVLAPRRLRGMMMGVWFFAMSAATVIASQLARLASVPHHLTNEWMSIPIYGHAFTEYGLIAIVAGIGLWIVSNKLHDWSLAHPT